MDGKKYDGDAPKELIDSTSAKYDPNNKDHVRSAKVKSYIQSFVDRFQEMKRLYAGGNIEAAKAKFDELFDAENMRDYYIFSDIVKNTDGFGKNWQWTTYNGVKWWVNAYDLDMSFGGHWQGIAITAPLTNHVNREATKPAVYAIYFYGSEMEQRYKELRDVGIIETEHILGYLRDWVLRIGTANFELEYEKWPDSPCIKNYTDSIYRVKKWIDTQISNMDNVYHYVPGSSITAELEQRLSSMEMQIEALRNEIDPDGIATDTDIDEALVGAWNTDVTVETEPEFDEMLNDIWNVNP